MTKMELKNWVCTSYNEHTDAQFDFYINERQCDVGDTAYMYCHEDDSLIEMTIAHTISRMSDIDLYDNLLVEDVLINGEQMLCADASAEFITNNDCYLIWFYCT